LRDALAKDCITGVVPSNLFVFQLLPDLRFWITTQESGILMLGSLRGTAHALVDQVRDELSR
jgi:hypothetical protein